MIATMIKSAIALLAAAVIVPLMRRQSASVRHAIWTAGLFAAMAIPLCAWLLPEWRMNAGGWAAGMLQDATVGLAGFRQTAIAIWLTGAAAGMLLLLYGTGKLMWVALGAGPVRDARWEALAEGVRKELGIRRPVRLVQNRRVPYLGTWGIVAPRVLLPIDADSWTDSRIRMVLGHELAHIKRHDWFVQVLADAARAIYWFNPMFWMASSRLRRESEQACDDAVVRMGAGSVQYAEELLQMTRSLRAEHALQTPILGMARPSQLEGRLVALLDPTLNRLAATPWAATMVVAVAVGLTLPLAAVRTLEVGPEVAPAPHSIATAPSEGNAAVEVRAAASSIKDPAVTGVKLKVSAVTGEPSVSVAAVTESAPEPPSPPTSLTAADARAQPPPAPSEAGTQPPAARSEAQPPAARSETVILPQPSLAAAPDSTRPYECKVTPSVRQARETLTKMSLGNGPWLMNEDKTIWAADQPYIAGRPITTLWMRPANTPLEVSGRRLDAAAPLLSVQPTNAYSAPYLAMALTFPEPGCWEVTAIAGGSKLTFVTRVRE